MEYVLQAFWFVTVPNCVPHRFDPREGRITISLGLLVISGVRKQGL